MKKVILIIILGFFWCGTANAGDCDTSISSATTSQLVCADDDSLTVTSDGSIAYDEQNAIDAQQEDGITITNRGTIKTTTDGSDGSSAIKGQSSLNLTVTNSGTILAKEDYGIKLIQAEKIKFEKQIFKNKILENENKELQKQIEKGVSKNEVNKFALLLFITALIVMSYGLASFITTILKVSFKR